jgi:hypothetical protein
VRAIGPSILSYQPDLLCSSDGGEGHPRLCGFLIVRVRERERERTVKYMGFGKYGIERLVREFIWTRVPRCIKPLDTELSLMIIFLF